MSDTLFVVYKLTSPSGKVYIGMSNNFDKRMRSHITERARHIRLRRPLSRFHSALSKYPLETWHKQILTTHLTRVEACESEKYCIQFNNSTDSSCGYNLASGGNGGDTGRNGDLLKRHTHSVLMKARNKDPTFVRNRIAKGLSTLKSDPDHYKAEQQRRQTRFREILGAGTSHRNHTGLWVAANIPYVTLHEAAIGCGLSESTVNTWCNNPDRIYRATNSRTGISKGQCPQDLGFYRITPIKDT